MRAPVSSAKYSREREMAIWMMLAAMGARMASRNAAMGLVPPSSSLLLPPKMAANCMKLAMLTMTEASTPATVWIRMSRLAIWPISWAMTPRSSSGLRMRMMPSVTATTPCSGSRPVAKALGASSGMTQTRGLGMPALAASSATMRCSRGASSSDSSRAWYMDSTILSEYQ